MEAQFSPAQSLTNEILVFDYYDLRIFFDPEDSSPITIYGAFLNKRNAAVIDFQNGIFNSVDIKNADGFDTLDEQDLNRFKLIIDMYLSEIVKSWIDYFVFDKEIIPERILRKID